MKYNGLSDKEVEESRKQHGSNMIPDSEPTTFWDEFKETFSDPMIKVLLAIAALMIAMFFFGYAEIYEPLGTIVAVLIVAFVSAKTGVASDTKYRELKESTEKDKCKVHRNGVITIIDVDDVVVGDKVLLQSGDKIPADGILIDGSLRVDNSALNGEAEECKKTQADESFQLADEITGDTFVDQHSLFRGAIVFDGEGILDVRKVGLKTMMGKMAEEWGADIINDVSEGGLTGIVNTPINESGNMFQLIGELKVPYILMSVKSNIKDMLKAFAAEVQQLRDYGAKDIILDPGYGFGKTLDDNYQILSEAEKLLVLDLPILVGVSRKSMIFKLVGGSPDTSLTGTVAINTMSLMKGAGILRVHDVKDAVDTVAVVEKMRAMQE